MKYILKDHFMDNNIDPIEENIGDIIDDLISDTSYRWDCLNNKPFEPEEKSRLYQNIAELPGMKSSRKMEPRYQIMQFPESFEGKTVLDLGCNLGRICIDAVNRGAKRAVGVDFSEKMIKTAKRFIKLRKKDFGEPMERVEFLVADLNDGLEKLKTIIKDDKFDYVFALSIWGVVNHEKLWEIINHYTKEACWFEGHKVIGKYRNQSKEYIENELKANLKGSPTFLGYTQDDKKVPRANFKINFSSR